MIPQICTIGPFPVYSYGVMLAVAVVVCTLLLGRDLPSIGVKKEEVFDLMFWTVLGGIVGARIFFIILYLPYFMAHPGEILMLQNGGLAWQGGLILGAVSAYRFIRKRGWPVWSTVDLLAPYLALGQAIGRIGCFLNGCCYGREVDEHFWASVYFPVHGAHLHPTQLYATLVLLVVFFILKKFQKAPHVPGQVLALYFILASLQRFVNEFFRADHVEGLLGLSVFQFVSLAVMAVGAALFVYLKKCPRKS